MRHKLIVLVLGCGLAVTAAAALANDVAARRGGAQAFPTAGDPVWSPDGRRIAYVATADGDNEIAVMNADGSGRRVITRNRSSDAYPDWTPGGRLVFTSDRDGDPEIYSMRPDGTQVVQLTVNEALDWMPDVSPDGTQVVFASARVEDAMCQIFVMAIDGSNQRRLVADEDDNHVPAWSPDGRRIAFEGGSDEAFVDVVNADGTGRVRLTNGGEETHPVWTADGRIVFGDWNGVLRIMNADGTDVRTIAATRGGEYRPSVSAGGRLVFEGDADGYSQIYVSRLDGTASRRLTGPPRAYTSTRDRCTIVGTARADVLRGTAGADVICGLGGDDRITGLGGADVLDGGAGRDSLDGGAGDDRLLGSSGDDRLVGAAGDDRLEGGAGADLLLARDGRRDQADGGPGRDRARVDAGDWVSFVEAIL